MARRKVFYQEVPIPLVMVHSSEIHEDIPFLWTLQEGMPDHQHVKRGDDMAQVHLVGELEPLGHPLNSHVNIEFPSRLRRNQVEVSPSCDLGLCRYKLLEQVEVGDALLAGDGCFDDILGDPQVVHIGQVGRMCAPKIAQGTINTISSVFGLRALKI